MPYMKSPSDSLQHPPSPLNGVSPYFMVEFSHSAVFPSFFIRTLLPFFEGPKDKQNSNIFWIASPHVMLSVQRKFLPFSHTETSSLKCAYSFTRPQCPSLNGIRAWTALSLKNFFSWWLTHFSTFTPPKSNFQKSYMQFQRWSTLSLPLKQFQEIWTWSLVTNLLSFNLCQHESNYNRQYLLITIGNISHCLLQLRIMKS